MKTNKLEVLAIFQMLDYVMKLGGHCPGGVCTHDSSSHSTRPVHVPSVLRVRQVLVHIVGAGKSWLSE